MDSPPVDQLSRCSVILHYEIDSGKSSSFRFFWFYWKRQHCLTSSLGKAALFALAMWLIDSFQADANLYFEPACTIWNAPALQRTPCWHSGSKLLMGWQSVHAFCSITVGRDGLCSQAGCQLVSNGRTGSGPDRQVREVVPQWKHSLL